MAMQQAATDEPGDVLAPEGTDYASEARQMTLGQLRRLGVSIVVYVRARTVDGQSAYAIHAADGTAMAVVDDIDLAAELVAERGLSIVTVH
jgi:hypothetical protein